MQNKNITATIIILLIIIAGVLIFIATKKSATNSDYQILVGDTANEKDTDDSYTNIEDEETEPESTTYTYENHGFTIELPKGYVVNEEQAETGPSYLIYLPNSFLTYVTNAVWWEQNNLNSSFKTGEQKIGVTTFQVYIFPDGLTSYWYKQGDVGYEFVGDIELLKTFKFVGWN